MVYDFFEELKEIIKEFFKWIIDKLKYFFVVIILLIWIFLLPNLNSVTPPNEVLESQEIYILGISISNWSQWISIITILYTACWAIYQYKKSLQIKKQEKASNIAKEFSNSIVEDLSILNCVMQKSILSKYIPNDEIDEKLKYFNVKEIRKLYHNDDIVTEYKDLCKINSKSLDNIYHLILYSMDTYISEEELKEYMLDLELQQKKWNEINEITKKVNKPYHFLSFERKVLNKLEYLCMDISSNAADSTFIYQSLHQMFLRSMRNLYFEISIVNTDSVDKLFTNIIYVYNEWKKMYKTSLRKERRLVKKQDEKSNPEFGHI